MHKTTSNIHKQINLTYLHPFSLADRKLMSNITSSLCLFISALVSMKLCAYCTYLLVYLQLVQYQIMLSVSISYICSFTYL